MKITQKRYPSPKGEITVFRIENASGASVELSTLGAGILSVDVPDRDGHLGNVALAYAEPADYLYDGPCMGKVPGRYANRIDRGHLEIDGRTFQLPLSGGPFTLHGGKEGFQNQIWEAEPTDCGVTFRYFSCDGEENFPGNLKVTARYEWSDDNTLRLRLEAETDRPTAVNLTNHTYWNLDGADAGSILDHLMRVRASRYLLTSDKLVPTGETAEVKGTPMDFTEMKAIGRDIRSDFPALNYGKGYDACWAIDSWKEGAMNPEAVTLVSEESGRTLTVGTDQPGVQIYTGNWLAGSPLNRSGRTYQDYEGVAIEAQGFPDAPNQPNFPSQILRPGQTYRREITFRFGLLK